MEYFEEIQDRVILIGVQANLGDDMEESLDELGELAATAGAYVAGRIIQNREAIHPGTYIGKGKIEEVKGLLYALNANGVICDDELSPAQMNNLERELECKVMDRTLLILDIFAKRAVTSEGKIQVELAQLRYRSARLVGLRSSLSRLGGGIGTRGPGEKKLETDRRLIRNRISALKQELSQVEKHRELLRSRRAAGNLKTAAIVGYTNAGKSTLLNTLSGADVLAEDKLFATLDPVVRTVKTPAGGEFLLVDTVGFISKLPHALVDAFHSTLEEALLADVLLIVSDGASGEMIRQHDVVLEVLSSLGAADKPMIDVINKADLPGVTANEWPGAIAISAKKGEGLDALLEAIRLKLRGAARPMRAVIPYAQGGLLAKIHADGQVLGEEYTAEGIDVTALADEQLFGRLAAQLGEQAVTWQD